MSNQESNECTVDLKIGGMTCAACSARIERRLNQLPDVVATVNLVTERAHLVGLQPDRVGEAIAAVESIGYTATRTDRRPQQRANSHHHGAPATGDSHDAHGSADHGGGAHAHDHSGTRLQERTIVAWVLGVPIALISMIPALQFSRWQLVIALPALIVGLWSAWPIHRTAMLGLRHRGTSMDTLISMGVLAALAVSLWRLPEIAGAATDSEHNMTGMGAVADGAGSTGHVFFEVAVAVVAFALLGRLLEHRAKGRASAAVRGLLDLAPERAWLVDPTSGVEVEVDVEAVAVGDLLRVRPGERFPTDGTVVEGRAAVDLSLVTGEAAPVAVGPDDAVLGGSMNLDGSVLMRASRVGGESTVARIAALVAEAQAGKAPVQRLADQVAAVFVPVVIALAVLTLVVGLALGRALDPAISAAMAVLVVACPCALGLATPIALVAGTGRAAQMGILVRGIDVLEASRAVDTVVFDKTGTITAGNFTLVAVATEGVSEERARAVAAALEAHSSHPLGVALRAAAPVAIGARGADLDIAAPVIAEFQNVAGWGVKAQVDSAPMALGRVDEVPADSPLRDTVERAASDGRSSVALYDDGRAVAVFVLADTPRPGAAAAVQALRDRGISVVLLTGDQEATARAVADSVGIDRVIAGVRPEGKVEAIRAAQADGATVAMVGDGLNDAAALAAADLGVAMAGGTDVAMEASDITLLRPEVGLVGVALDVARATLRVIRGNLFWAFAYNVAMIPLAMTGRLDPMWAGGAMALSSLFVVLNSIRLLRVGR